MNNKNLEVLGARMAELAELADKNSESKEAFVHAMTQYLDELIGSKWKDCVHEVSTIHTQYNNLNVSAKYIVKTYLNIRTQEIVDAVNQLWDQDPLPKENP